MDCSECLTRFLVNESLIRREMATVESTGNAECLLPENEPEPGKSPARPVEIVDKSAGSAWKSSAAHQAMMNPRDENGDASQSPAKSRGKSGTADRGKRKRPQTVSPVVLAIGGAGAIVIMALIVTVLILAMNGGSGNNNTANPPESADKNQQKETSPPPHPNTNDQENPDKTSQPPPLIVATRLTNPEFELADRPLSDDPQPTRGLTLINSRWTTTNKGALQLEAEVACHTAAMNRDLDWMVMLVDEQRVFAQVVIRSYLLGQSKTEKISIEAAGMGDVSDMAGVRIMVEPILTVPLSNPMVLDDAKTIMIASGRTGELELTATGESLPNIMHMLAQVTAIDEQGHVLGRWLIDEQNAKVKEGVIRIRQTADLADVPENARLITRAVGILTQNSTREPTETRDQDTITQPQTDTKPVKTDADPA